MTFLDLIKADLKCVRLFVDGVDEADLNIAAYHCQQAVEKICSYISQKHGLPSLRTHKIEKWVEFLQEKDIYVPELIVTKAETLSDWQSYSRYNINFIVSKKEVRNVAEIAEQWLATVTIPKVSKKPKL